MLSFAFEFKKKTHKTHTEVFSLKGGTTCCPIANSLEMLLFACCCSANIFSFLAGQGTRTGATDKGAATGQSPTVYPANRNEGHGAACRPH